MTKVSFDLDGVLEFENVQNYAKELIEKGFEVWITTSRYDVTHLMKIFKMDIESAKKARDDLYDIAKKIGMSVTYNRDTEKIHFTNMKDKYEFLKNNDFLWHLDDDNFELMFINRNTKVKGIDALSSDWKEQCEKILKNYENKM